MNQLHESRAILSPLGYFIFVRIELSDRERTHVPGHASVALDLEVTKQIERHGGGRIVVIQRNEATPPLTWICMGLQGLE